MQIFQHSNVDHVGACLNVLGRRERVLTFIKNIFGFETLVFATLRVLYMHKQLETLQKQGKLEIVSYDPFKHKAKIVSRWWQITA